MFVPPRLEALKMFLLFCLSFSQSSVRPLLICKSKAAAALGTTTTTTTMGGRADGMRRESREAAAAEAVRARRQTSRSLTGCYKNLEGDGISVFCSQRRERFPQCCLKILGILTYALLVKLVRRACERARPLAASLSLPQCGRWLAGDGC